MQYLQRGLDSSNRSVLRDHLENWTYHDLANRTESIAWYLSQRIGLRPGDRVGIFMQRNCSSVAGLLGAWSAGGIVVPLAVRGAPREIAHQIADAGISVIIADSGFANLVNESVQLLNSANIPLLVSFAELAGSVPRHPVSDLPLADPALILYTSGTTGRPKGVLHTHSSLMAQVESLYQAWRWTCDDSLLHVLPLHHIHGLVNGVLGAIWAGAGLHFLEQFSPESIWESWLGGTDSVFYAVPTIYHQLAELWQQQPASRAQSWSEGARALRLVVSGSAALPSNLWGRWNAMTGQALLERYGMTEIGMAISNPYAGERRAGTVGQVLPSVEMRIVSESGTIAEKNAQGEIWIRGPTLFREYWNNPAATREAFSDGYFRTGDIATCDDGYVRILGRASVDILKSAGYKISALEIEEVLLEHPAIAEVAVVGIPDPQWGEVVTACIVVRGTQSLEHGELRLWCSHKLAPYKVPRRIELWASLPRNSLGKITKSEIVRQLSEIY